MKCKNLLVWIVGVVTLVMALQSVNAFGAITHVEVNGANADSGNVNFASETSGRIPVFIQFKATENEQDVRVVAWLSGERRNGVESERFDVLVNRTYTKVIYLDAPQTLNELNEPKKLEIVVESDDAGTADSRSIDLTIQRESYQIEILSVDMQPEIKAGGSLFVDVVLKNRGSHFAEDNFVRVSIPELQVETKSYFGDLSSLDQANPDKEDTVEKRVFLRIPDQVPTGLYTVKVEASNPDATVSAEKRVLISGLEREARVITSSTTKTFSTSEQGEYKLTLVNKGNTIEVYTLVIDSPKELDVESDDTVVVVPAGTSKTVTLTANAAQEVR